MLARSPQVTVATVALNQFRGQYSVNIPGLMAAVVLTIVPIVLVYVFARRAGVMGRGVKYGTTTRKRRRTSPGAPPLRRQ